MTAASYKPSLSLVLAHEGGYVNHPQDPGGATNKGVTQKVYDAYRKLRGLKVQSVKLIDALETEEIYRKNYWKLVRGDSLPAGLDYAVFDFAVNSGVSRAIRYLQRCVNVNDDAVLGDMSMTAILDSAAANEELLITKYCANRLAFMRSLSIFKTFGTGWTRRVVGYVDGYQESDSGVLDLAINMARGDTAFTMPTQIGMNPVEIPAKAISAEPEVFPAATADDILALMKTNDQLALKIALSEIR